MKRTPLTLILAIAVWLLTVAAQTAYATPTTAWKGFASNDPPTVNLLSPGWVQTDFGTWLMSYNFGTTKLVLNTNATNPLPPADILLLTTHPNYDRWWLIGYNEPDLISKNAQEAADRIIEQGNAILAVDPTAKLSITGMSQEKAMSRSGYFWKIWNKLPENIKARVKGINIHFYVQYDQPESVTFSAQPIIDYLDAERASMVAHGIGDKQLWLTEIALHKTAYTLAHMDEVNNYPNVIQAAANGRVERWAYTFQLATSPDYYAHTLMPYSPYGTLTDMGQTFKDLP